MSTLKVDNILNTAGADNRGKILQVQTTNVSTTSSQAITAYTHAEITGVSVNITPSSTSSKILLQCSWMGELSDAANYNHVFSFKRNDTYLGSPVAGNRLVGIGLAGRTFDSTDFNSTPNSSPFLQYIDTPATTSQLTYKLNFVAGYTFTLYNNRTLSDTAVVSRERGMSMITAMEIAG